MIISLRFGSVAMHEAPGSHNRNIHGVLRRLGRRRAIILLGRRSGMRGSRKARGL
jgi:hypothetical protein